MLSGPINNNEKLKIEGVEMIELKMSGLMQKSLDALWLKQKVISNNIANIDTPGFKSKSVKFEEYISNNTDPENVPDPEIVTNNFTAMREDGNNVDIDKENLELYRAQIQYEYMVRKISDEFNKMKIVLTEGRK